MQTDAAITIFRIFNFSFCILIQTEKRKVEILTRKSESLFRFFDFSFFFWIFSLLFRLFVLISIKDEKLKWPHPAFIDYNCFMKLK
jgi:hypothetical protein